MLSSIAIMSYVRMVCMSKLQHRGSVSQNKYLQFNSIQDIFTELGTKRGIE